MLLLPLMRCTNCYDSKASYSVVFFLFVAAPPAMGIYPLNGIFQGRDIGRFKNPNARIYNAESSTGPDNLPAGSFKVRGLPNSYIRYSGRLDTVNAITVAFWLRPESSGPVFVYRQDGTGFAIQMLSSNTMEVRYVSRQRKLVKKMITRHIKPKRWNYMAVTYSRKNGYGTIWQDSVPVAQKSLGRFQLATDKVAFTGKKTRGNTYFRGSISCLHVYNVALNGYQLRSLKKSCFRGKTRTSY